MPRRKKASPLLPSKHKTTSSTNGDAGGSPPPDDGTTSSWADLDPLPPPRVRITKKWVTIRAVLPHTSWDYDFRTSRIDTPMKLLQWVWHLNEKKWFDWALCRELIDKVCTHFDWDLHALC
jgi:hypothetical protein